jgi:hypothetical protein
MGFGEKMCRLAGWFCLGLVAAFVLMGYYFGNIRFAPLAGGFMILSAIFLIERGQEEVERNGIYPGTDSGVDRARR